MKPKKSKINHYKIKQNKELIDEIKSNIRFNLQQIKFYRRYIKDLEADIKDLKNGN